MIPVEGNPLVVLAGFPNWEVDKCKNALAEEKFDAYPAGNLETAMEAAKHPRCIAVFFCDTLHKDLLLVLRDGRKISQAQWMVYSRDQNATYRLKLSQAGAASVLEYPVNQAHVLSRTRQYFAKDKDRFYNRLHRAIGTEREKEHARKKKANVGSGVEAMIQGEVSARGLEMVKPAHDYITRREWSHAPREVPFEMGSADLKAGIDQYLFRAAQDMKGNCRISFVALGSESPFVEENPKKFCVLASSVSFSKSEIGIDPRRYPEIQRVMKAKRPISISGIDLESDYQPFIKELAKTGIKSVAAIPLMRGQMVFSVFILRFNKLLDAQARQFIRDFSSYADEITPMALRLDFLARQVRIKLKEAK